MRFTLLFLLFAAATTAKSAGPDSWKLTTFSDPVTRVSFQYPAAFHPAKDVKSYFSPALTQMKGLTFHAKLAYIPPPVPKADEATTDLGELDFLYATKPAQTASSCYELTRNWTEMAPQSTGSIAIHGVQFAFGSVEDTGLSHFVSGKLYATFRNGTCFIFEQDTIGLDGYVGDITQTQWRSFDRHLSDIAQTIRFAPSPR